MENLFIHQDLNTKWMNRARGIILVVVIAITAHYLGNIFSLIGSILFAIILGLILGSIWDVRTIYQSGLNFVVAKLLKLAVVLLGVSLNLNAIVEIGRQSLIVVITSVVLGIALTYWFGKLLKLDHTLVLMIGIGTSICGTTAITCVKGILEAKEDETAYAISTIVFFNLIAFFVYPFVGQLLNFNAIDFGIWSGTAVHDTSSAVAVGFAYSGEAGDVATTVKLARTLFLLPVVLILSILMGNQKKGNVKSSLKNAFPWFILWFIFMSILNSLGFFSERLQVFSNDFAKFIIVMVMAAVGLQVNLKGFVKLGYKPFLTGLFASVVVSIVSLIMIRFLS